MKKEYDRPDRTGMAAGYGNGSRVGRTVVNTMVPGQPNPDRAGKKKGFDAPTGNTKPA